MTASLDTEIQFEIHPSQTRVPAADRARVLEAPGFGQVFTDHMITLRWTAERGWHDGKLEPYGPFSLDPATAVFHYGQELFEGLKAYRQDSGSIVMFRPQANAARFNAGCRRMAMPELPEETFLRALELIVVPGQGLDPGRRGQQPLPPPVHDRHAAGPGGQPPVRRVPVLRHRLAGRRVLRREQDRQGLAVGGLHPRRPRRHGRGQVRRQLRGGVRRAAAGRGQGLRPGRLARRRDARVRGGDGRHEPVLRVRFRAVGPRRDAGAHRVAAAGHHP